MSSIDTPVRWEKDPDDVLWWGLDWALDPGVTIVSSTWAIEVTPTNDADRPLTIVATAFSGTSTRVKLSGGVRTGQVPQVYVLRNRITWSAEVPPQQADKSAVLIVRDH